MFQGCVIQLNGVGVQVEWGLHLVEISQNDDFLKKMAEKLLFGRPQILIR